MTWSRVPAPVRRGRLPGRWRRRDGAPAKRVGLTVYRPSDSTRRSAGYVRCGPSAWRQNRVRDERCNCTRRKRCCNRPAPYSRVKPLPNTGSGGWWWSTGWRGWSNRGSASPATSAVPKPGSSCTWPPPCQPDPGGRQSRVDRRNRLRSQRRQRPGRWNGQLRRQCRHRLARANLDPHPARIGLTDQIPLHDKGFPSGFLGPYVAVVVKRLHDIDTSGIMSIFCLIPLVAFIAVIVLGVWPGTKGTNRYDPAEKPAITT